MRTKKSPKDFSKKANIKAETSDVKGKLPAANLRAVAEGGKPMLYSITKEGKVKLHRDLSKWRKPVGKHEYFELAPSPKEAQQEKEFRALISRCTKELSLEQESAVAVKNMRKQEYLDALAN